MVSLASLLFDHGLRRASVVLQGFFFRVNLGSEYKAEPLWSRNDEYRLEYLISQVLLYWEGTQMELSYWDYI